MKKVFNLSIILAVLAAAFTFSSCKEEEEGPAINAMEMNGFVTGGIVSEAGLKSATLEKDGKTVSGWPLTDFGAGKAVSGSAKEGYTITISGLEAGKYVFIAIDKNDKKDSFEFTVGGGTIQEPDWSKGTNTITANGTYDYKQGTNKGVLVVSNLSAASVTVKLDNYTEVVLSDNGDSYLLKTGISSPQSGANASNFLLAKSGSEAKIVDADGLKTKIPGAETVIFVKK